MSSYAGSLKFDTRIDTRGFNRGTNDITKQVNGMSVAVKKLGGLVALAFGVKQLVAFGKASVDVASDLEEAQNVVDVVFGNMAESINAFSKTSIEQFGLSELSAKRYAGVFGSMSISMGLSEEAALSLSKAVTGLTGDTASLFNTTNEVAYTKLKSIWTGETETLKDWGIVMTQANLKQFALNQGITKTIDKMTEAEKVMLRYNYVNQALSKVHGDFARNSDSWANQTRILSEQFKALQAIIGRGMVRVMLPVVNTLNVLLARLRVVAELFAKVFGGGDVTISNAPSKQAEQLEDYTSSSADNMADMTDETKKAGKELNNLLGGFDEVNTLSKESAEGASGAVIGGIGGIDVSGGSLIDGAATAQEIDKVSEKLGGLISILDSLKQFKEISFNNIVNSLQNLKVALEPFTQMLFSGIKWGIENVLYPLAKWTIEDVIPNFLNILAGSLKVLEPIIVALQPLFKWLWDSFLQPLATYTGGVVVKVLGDIAKVLKDIGKWMKDNQKIVDTITYSVVGFFGAWKVVELMSFVQQAGGVIAVLGKIKSALFACTLAKIADKAETVALQLMYAKEFVVSMGKGLVAIVKNTTAFVANKAIILATTLAQKAMTVATLAWNAACAVATAVTTGFSAAVAFLTSPIGLVVVAITSLIAIIVLLVKNWDEVKEAGAKSWEWIKNTWNSASEWMRTRVGEPIKATFESLKATIQNAMLKAKEVMQNAWQGVASWFDSYVLRPLQNGFKGAVNGIASMAEFFANIWVKAVNTVVRALNKISFEIPDIAGIPNAGKKIGINLREVNSVSLPRLAKGAVIPPNSEFMAILGDQKRGVNIETPLETMVDAFKMALSEMGGTGKEIILEVDGMRIARAMMPELLREGKRMGVSTV